MRPNLPPGLEIARAIETEKSLVKDQTLPIHRAYPYFAPDEYTILFCRYILLWVSCGGVPCTQWIYFDMCTYFIIIQESYVYMIYIPWASTTIKLMVDPISIIKTLR